MKKTKFNRDVDELKEKIHKLLEEYDSKIEYDQDVDLVVIVDNDTKEFTSVDYIVGW